DAARLAGIDRVEFIQEPIAAAIASGWSADHADEAWMVFDLGGGTFDVSLLETREGMLRVVGHDGDNYLGGRDFDNAIVDWAVRALAEREGRELDRRNPAHAKAFRRLKAAAEEVKIELSRAKSSTLTVPGLVIDGDEIDVDLELERAAFDRAVAPLCDRVVEVCARLMSDHGRESGSLARIVLVGGPTAIPALRERVAAALGAPFAVGLDPMTLVAQGAAIFAGTVDLPAKPAAGSTTAAPATDVEPRTKLWLQHPGVTADVGPFVVGRVLEGDPIHKVRFTRLDGAWTSPDEDVEDDGTFTVQLALSMRMRSTFRVEAWSKDGALVPVSPAEISVSHGLTVTDPPLSRSIGIALATDEVRTYFERGCPLPARRSFVLHTVEAATPIAHGFALQVPIVQGEFGMAHLCRLVGVLSIPASDLKAPLAAGSAIEVALGLDRGGRLTASARVDALGQAFDEIVDVDVPIASIADLRDRHGKLQRRVEEAFAKSSDPALRTQLSRIDASLGRAERDLAAADGGDADGLERARRTLSDADGELADLESRSAWPELESDALEEASFAAGNVARYGTAADRQLLEGMIAGIKRALAARDARALDQRLRAMRRLSNGLYLQDPANVAAELDYYASDPTRTTDPKRAKQIIESGRAALAKNDTAGARRALDAVWELRRPGEETRRRGHGSSVK
ncbi:MAG TPA: Hsp70 family protein, partial [Polyangiaceae bacterium]|nr:Hsp70 family protein [Polyangiaceae bacterium]